jgi:hypothetical protein
MKTAYLAAGACRVALVGLFVLASCVAASAGDKEAGEPERTRVNLQIRPSFALQGHSVQARVLVEPASSNRLLIVRVDSLAYYASTERQLQGQDGPRTHVLSWHELPAGEYVVEAVVKNTRGEAVQAQGRFTILGPEQPQMRR